MIDPHPRRAHGHARPPASDAVRPPLSTRVGRLDSRRTEAIDQLVGDVPKAVRRRMQVVLQPFPTGTLEALYAHGVRFHITEAPSEAQKASSEDGLQMLGGYNLITREIQLMRSTLLGEDGPHTVIHELCHALDHMRGERIRKPSRFDSENVRRARAQELAESALSSQVHALYQRYQARGGVEDVADLRDEVRALSDDKKTLPHKASLTSTFDGWGDRPVRYERKDGVETFVIDAAKRGNAKALVLEAGLGSAIAATSLLFPPAAPVALGIGGLLAGTALKEAAERFIHKKRASKSEVDVPMQRGVEANVVQHDERTVITVPEGARPLDDAIWSPYAHRGSRGLENRGVVEYTAEAYATWLEGGEHARAFRDADPEMYALAEQRLHDEFNLHP